MTDDYFSGYYISCAALVLGIVIAAIDVAIVLSFLLLGFFAGYLVGQYYRS